MEFMQRLVNEVGNAAITFKKHYYELKEFIKNQSDLSIADLQYKNGSYLAIVNIRNKSIFTRFKIGQLKSPEVINKFGEGDQKLIKSIAGNEIKSPLKFHNIKIVAKSIRNSPTSIFTINMEPNSTKSYRQNLNSKEIIHNKFILYSLPKEDIYEVAYTRGQESILQEKLSD